MRSQDTIGKDSLDLRPVVLPFWMAKEIALDLSEKEQLEQFQVLLSKEISLLRSLVNDLERIVENKTIQIRLLKDQKTALNFSLKTERLKKPRDNLWKWLVRITGALGVGFMVGTIMEK